MATWLVVYCGDTTTVKYLFEPNSADLLGEDPFLETEKLERMSTPSKKPSVFDRLYDTRSYTGVYAERFKGADGRINAHTDLSVVS